jgi:hypothetical protein
VLVPEAKEKTEAVDPVSPEGLALPSPEVGQGGKGRAPFPAANPHVQLADALHRLLRTDVTNNHEAAHNVPVVAYKWFLLAGGVTAVLPLTNGQVHEWWTVACVPYAGLVGLVATGAERFTLSVTSRQESGLGLLGFITVFVLVALAGLFLLAIDPLALEPELDDH